MAVYVDDMYKHSLGRYGRMKMSHLIADTEEELHAMAARIGVARHWYQGDHYDIAMSKRSLAVEAGAIEVTMVQLSSMCRRLKVAGTCGNPEDARQWWSEYRKQQRAAKKASEAGCQGIRLIDVGPGHRSIAELIGQGACEHITLSQDNAIALNPFDISPHTR